MTFDTVAIAADLARRLGVRADRDVPLAKHTTMRVGGPADLFAVAHNGFELRGLIRFARARGLPHCLLGRGSDIVVSDRGIRGLVISVRAEGSRVDGTRYVADAGLQMARAATETQRAGLTGLEFGLAIPGTVGGAVWANAGAHGSEVSAVLAWADVLLSDGTEARLTPAELGFSYRDSRLKRAPAVGPLGGPGEVVLAAAFDLAPAAPEDIRARLDDIRRWRQAHQPLGMASAGSVFRNPSGEAPAGLLIDRAGLKGSSEGGAVVSEKHANFIVARAGATASDVRRLADRVRATILERDGIALEFEIEFVGDWDGWPWPPDATDDEEARP